jgi:hypothetical protein
MGALMLDIGTLLQHGCIFEMQKTGIYALFASFTLFFQQFCPMFGILYVVSIMKIKHNILCFKCRFTVDKRMQFVVE